MSAKPTTTENVESSIDSIAHHQTYHDRPGHQPGHYHAPEAIKEVAHLPPVRLSQNQPLSPRILTISAVASATLARA